MTRTCSSIICAAALVLVVGCATERWVQPGKTGVEVKNALLGCEQSMPPKPDPFAEPVYTLPDQSFIVRCMKDKGYQLVRK